MVLATRLRAVLATLALVAAFVATSMPPARAIGEPPITGGTSAEHETVLEAWRIILDTLPHQAACVSDPVPSVVIRPSNHVGIYDYRVDMIILRAGGFRLADAVHEFAHHVDWECGFDSEDEEVLWTTTDIADYLRDTGWKYRPLEIFAESVVKLALGPEASSAGGRASALHPGPAVLGFVTRWSGGGQQPQFGRSRLYTPSWLPL